jgi:hypothetical protein
MLQSQTHQQKTCKVRTQPNPSKRTSSEELVHMMNECGISPDQLLNQSEWTYDYLTFHHDVKEKVGLCLCGRKIKTVVYLLHLSTDTYYQMCFDCISNHLPWMKQLIELDKQREYFNRMLKTKKHTTPSELYRSCVSCHEKVIHFSEPKKMRCKPCFLNFVPADKTYFRPCKTCDRYVILKTEPEHRVQCINCFMDNPTPYCIHCQGTGLAAWSSELFRECSECFS